jgi:hypothetical protein
VLCSTVISVRTPHHNQDRTGLLAILVLLMAGCTSDPAIQPADVSGKTVCDSYIVLDMCVEDLVGDGSVDMVYFSDTNEIFMYRDGMKTAVADEMPFHRCAVPLNPGMQSITNRILMRDKLSMTEELGIKRDLLTNFIAAKPEIDACNARFDRNAGTDIAREEEFYMGDSDWLEE